MQRWRTSGRRPGIVTHSSLPRENDTWTMTLNDETEFFHFQKPDPELGRYQIDIDTLEVVQRRAKEEGLEFASDEEIQAVRFVRIVDDDARQIQIRIFDADDRLLIANRMWSDLHPEMASVLGHEIGHVTGRHSVEQQSTQQLAQIGLMAAVLADPLDQAAA